MNHFGSTFVLCFLGFLFIQAKAFPSWKTCSAHSDCQATGEYCEKGYSSSSSTNLNKCSYCVSSHSSDSFDGSVPTWCSDYTKFDDAASTTITSSSVLTFAQESAWENGADGSTCPTFDSCLKNCRKKYTVEKTALEITLTSTFADTTDCVCDKILFSKVSNGDPAPDTSDIWSSTYNFGVGLTADDTVQLGQCSSSGIDINLWQDQGDFDCVWEYSIGTSSSPAATLTGLLGLISASVVAFALV